MYDPQTGNIDLSEGLTCLRNGKQISRRCWPEAMHLYLDDKIIFRRFQAGFIEGWIPGLQDLTADDWYEVINAEQK